MGGTNSQNPEAEKEPVVTGGIEEANSPFESDKVDLEKVEPPVVEKPASPPERIVFNGKTFNSMDELLAYTAELERQKIVWESKTVSEEQQEVMHNANTPDPADYIFEDPKTAFKLMKEQTKEEIRREYKDQVNSQAIVNKFYRDYPDLVGNEDLVDYHSAKLAPELKSLPNVEARFQAVAKEVRRRINDLRANSHDGRQLPSGPAVVAGSGNSPVATPINRPTPRTSFVEDLKHFQRRK